MEQGGAGSPVAQSRSREDERNSGPQQSHSRGEPQASAAPQRDTRTEGKTSQGSGDKVWANWNDINPLILSYIDHFNYKHHLVFGSSLLVCITNND